MDEPASLVDEWHRKMVFPALEALYDEIWVYGLPEIFDPLREIPGMTAVADKVRFTGYLERTVPEHTESDGGAPGAQREVHPGDARRWRRRGRARRLGDQRLRAGSRPAAPGRPADGPVHAGGAAGRIPGTRRAAIAGCRRSPSRRGSSRSSSAPAPWSPWAATTRSARSCRSASRPCWCRAPRRGWSNISAPSGHRNWVWCGCWPMTACGHRRGWRLPCASCRRCRCRRRASGARCWRAWAGSTG